MIGKILKENLLLLFLTVFLLTLSSVTWSNTIYITQSGANLDLDITQDGQNNEIEGLSGSGSAIVYGTNSTVTFTQTGDSNQIRVWSDSSSGKSTTNTQTGNNNISLSDNHGQDNTMTTNVTGNSNYTFNEIGNGGDTDNTITTTVVGDNNNIIAEVQDGDNNTIDTQTHQSNNILRIYVDGDNNNSKVWQGKHEDGDVDNNETGDNDAYWYITGNNNTTASYQTDDNGNGGQYTFNDIDGNSNTIKITIRIPIRYP